MHAAVRPESNRIDMEKNFGDAKAPLNMLQFWLQLKAFKNDAFKPFFEELDKAFVEQNRSMERLGYDVATCEVIEPVQVSIFI